VDTDEQARDLSALQELAGEEVRAGMKVELPPCLAPADLAELRKETGQECPRPGPWMDADNVTPLEAVFLSLNENTRHLVEGTLRDEVPKGERPAVRRRVALALQSQPVATWHEAMREEAKAKTQAKR
jgi:hypothetical protein